MPAANLREKIGDKSRVTASLRFFFTISLALGLSYALGNPQLGGFAALGAFMALLSDTESDLISRLSGELITFVGLMTAAGLGIYLKDSEYGRWAVIALVCFGQSLMTFAERFWWLWGKYVLVFLLISIFDFTPDLMDCLGYAMGFGLSMLMITADHFIWRYEKLGLRPMAQLKLVEGGQTNSYAYAAVSTLILLCSMGTATFLGLQEPGWVGITVVYLINSNISCGFSRIIQRLIGTLVAYFFVIALFPFVDDKLILGGFIVAASMGIPVFVGGNYTCMTFFITAYLLFLLDWLMAAYGGDGRILVWRIWDTLAGAAWVVLGLCILYGWDKFTEKPLNSRNSPKD